MLAAASKRSTRGRLLQNRGSVRAAKRQLTNDSPSSPASLPSPPTPPRKRRGLLHRAFLYGTALTIGFYAGSTLVSLGSEEYRNYFIEHIPLGERIIEFTDKQGWDRAVVKSRSTGRSMLSSASQLEHKLEEALPPAAAHALDRTKQAVKLTTTKASQAAHEIKSSASELVSDAQRVVAKSYRIAKGNEATSQDTPVPMQKTASPRPSRFSEELMDLVSEAEAALNGTYAHIVSVPSVPPSDEGENSQSLSMSRIASASANSGNVYERPLPIGFEPPPGYVASRSQTPKLPTHPPGSPLAQGTVSFPQDEPIIVQLAAHIDALSGVIQDNPAISQRSQVILDSASHDLITLAHKIEQIKADGRKRVEQRLDEQALEYNNKVAELEMSAQDRIDIQQQEWKTLYDQERDRLMASYREKLDAELEKHNAIIGERLQAEVINQGIELQRRWMRDIKMYVEQEREGRLSKLDVLASSLQKLERLTLDNATYLDENLQIHALTSSIRAITKTLSSPAKKPFREELRVLRGVAGVKQIPIILSTLDSLEATSIPDYGVEPFAELASWFSYGVAPRLQTIALVPNNEAGVLPHLIGYLMSGFQFRRHGLVTGDDVLSVVARAEYYLNEKNLDSAARELNQLQGPAKSILEDWLTAARNRLEVQQALEVMQAQTTLASLMIV